MYHGGCLLISRHTYNLGAKKKSQFPFVCLSLTDSLGCKASCLSKHTMVNWDKKNGGFDFSKAAVLGVIIGCCTTAFFFCRRTASIIFLFQFPFSTQEMYPCNNEPQAPSKNGIPPDHVIADCRNDLQRIGRSYPDSKSSRCDKG